MNTTKAPRGKILLLSSLCLTLGASLHAQTGSAPAASCVADFSVPAKPLNPYFLGANTSFFNRPYDFTNPNVVALTKQLNLQTLRFPTGSPSNWFNWKTGTFFTDDILAKRVPAAELKANKSTGDEVTMAKYHPSFKINDMVAFCRSAGAIPIWVTNLMSGTPQEAADWVAYNKQQGNPNNFWELGNEIYLKPYQSQFPTVQSYLKVARVFADAMKKADPSILVGIDGTSVQLTPPASSQGDGVWVQNSNRSDWDVAIAKEHFYDAVIIHDYFLTNMEMIGQSEDEVHRYLMARNALNMPASIDYYRRTFGPNVQLWMTEWNLFSYLGRAFKANPGQFPKDFALRNYWLCRTVDHALFVADWYLEALRFPENVKITDIHVLCSQGFWGLFQLPAPEKDNTDKAFLINSPFYAVSWLGDAMKKSDSYVFGKIEGGPTLKGGITYRNFDIPGIVAGAFFKGQTMTGVLFINKTTAPQSISCKGIGSASLRGATSQCLTGASPLEDWGKDKSAKNEDAWRPQFQVTTAAILGDTVSLPPASLTYVVFK